MRVLLGGVWVTTRAKTISGATRIPVPYWTESTKATDCNTCGRDIWVGERCVISGPTIHCRLCGALMCEDDGGVR